jgi:hypothetical protein
LAFWQKLLAFLGSWKGDNNALVPLFGVLLRGRIPCQHLAPSWQWDFGTRIPEPLRITTGVGLSSSLVNVMWGLFNLVVAYLLVCRVGSFNLRKTQHVLVLGAGILIMSLMLAHAFGPLHGGQ